MGPTPKQPDRETALYPPIRDYLEARGYTVRSEVRHCDVAAVRGDDIVLIEIKRVLSVSLLVQAARRQRISQSVYIAVPDSARIKRPGEWRGFLHLLRRLELGLILVRCAPPSAVQVVLHPQPLERKQSKTQRRALLEEARGRSGDFNLGGSARRKLVTAYRENAIHIACCLRRWGNAAPKELRAFGTGPKTLSILYRNVYGWFARTERGRYTLSATGIAALEEYPDLARHYDALLAAAAPHKTFADNPPVA
ncbi:MAG TPA: DUF2161 family putative PD-(D/E)XK-type phosphodiesterase [Candidatus Hydrogenedentes bacterium]|nr:DUF2161 family putative PD-(D/E)XK-type phosphodiesterase [Candidatus Hydrogenedentota bacterium]